VLRCWKIGRAYSLAQLKQHQGKDRISRSGNRRSREPLDYAARESGGC
jgi:hypothetical protein